jgi:hypothetical protein
VIVSRTLPRETTSPASRKAAGSTTYWTRAAVANAARATNPICARRVGRSSAARPAASAPSASGHATASAVMYVAKTVTGNETVNAAQKRLQRTLRPTRRAMR